MAHSQSKCLGQAKCLGYHIDASGLFQIFDPDMWYQVQSAGAQRFVCLSGLWVDAEMNFAEILQPGNHIGMSIHKARIPKDWLLYFSANMPHGVWRLPGCHGTRASLTHRGYLTPTFSTKVHSKKIRSEDCRHLYENPLGPVLWWNTDFSPAAGPAHLRRPEEARTEAAHAQAAEDCLGCAAHVAGAAWYTRGLASGPSISVSKWPSARTC